jgi:NADPH:quinone reductase-like Zn-dependent oxidoreductase
MYGHPVAGIFGYSHLTGGFAGGQAQFAMDGARVLGAAKVLAIDKEPYRLGLAERAGHTPLNFEEVDVRSALLELTGGRGPDKCIDAVGREAVHGSSHFARLRPDQAGDPPGDRSSVRSSASDHELP